MRLLLLCGVDNAGKSTAVRYSTKYLGIDPGIVKVFLTPGPYVPRPIMVNGIPVYMYCTSPQEVTHGIVKECRRIFAKRIEAKESNSLIVMPFNIEDRYEEATEACLLELNERSLKSCTSFVFLDANIPGCAEENDEARVKMEKLKIAGYTVIGTIIRSTEDSQGQDFSTFIKSQIKLLS